MSYADIYKRLQKHAHGFSLRSNVAAEFVAACENAGLEPPHMDVPNIFSFCLADGRHVSVLAQSHGLMLCVDGYEPQQGLTAVQVVDMLQHGPHAERKAVC